MFAVCEKLQLPHFDYLKHWLTWEQWYDWQLLSVPESASSQLLSTDDQDTRKWSDERKRAEFAQLKARVEEMKRGNVNR